MTEVAMLAAERSIEASRVRNLSKNPVAALKRVQKASDALTFHISPHRPWRAYLVDEPGERGEG